MARFTCPLLDGSHGARALALASIAVLTLGCGDGEQQPASLPQSAPAATPAAQAPPAVTLSPSDSADSLRKWRLQPDSACADAIPPMGCRPFVIDGVAYTVEIEEYAGPFARGTRRVHIYDDSARVVYTEAFRNPFPDSTDSKLELTDAAEKRNRKSIDDVPNPKNWTALDVERLEDATGQPRAFLLTYLSRLDIGYVPSVYHRILAPREGTLRTLVSRFEHPGMNGVFSASMFGSPIGWAEGTGPGRRRLLDGNRFIVAEWRNRYTAYIPYQVNLDCEPGASSCITLALSDSIGGLPRFAVDTLWQLSQYASDNAVTLDLYSAPGAQHPERITVKRRGTRLLEGAGPVRFGGAGIEGTDTDLTSADWLRIRVGGTDRTGWIPARNFDAIGLERVPRRKAGSEVGEM